MGDEDAPTEFAGLAGVATESVHAWAEDEGCVDVVVPRRLWGVVVATALLAVVGFSVAVVLGMRLITEQAAPAAQPVEATTTVVQPTRTVTLTKPDQDTAFLQELDKTGIFYDAAGVAIHNAKLVCRALESGQTEAALVESFGKFNELAPREAAPFVSIAISHYCPRNTD